MIFFFQEGKKRLSHPTGIAVAVYYESVVGELYMGR